MRFALMTALALLCGCVQTGTRYLEGTSLQLGAYVPVSGQLYGVEAVSYISGVRLGLPTNSNLTVVRTSSSETSWLGVFRQSSTNRTFICAANADWTCTNTVHACAERP